MTEATINRPSSRDSKNPAEEPEITKFQQLVSDDDQDGVHITKAVTLSWSKTSLVVVYCCMWLLYFCRAMISSLSETLTPFVTSDFQSHSLMPVINVMTSILSAATYMPIAKILNIWDRTFGFSAMMGLATLGLILMAASKSFAVYTAANVFYNIGFTGMIFAVDIMTADFSSLKMRAFAYALTSSSYIITAFGGPKAAETIYESNWRWGFGAWTIVLPAVSAPMIYMLQRGKRLAKENGLLNRQRSNRTWAESCKYHFIEFDVIGVFLLSAGFVLFLLPFTIAADSKDQWRSAYIIAMLVLGFVLIVVFALWERFGASVPVVPWKLLKSPCVMGACLIAATYQISYACWNSYFTSYLQVVYDISKSRAGYINNIFNVVSGIELFLVGILIRWSGRYKWVFMWGIPLYILGVGLLIYFRQPNHSLGYIIMCQIFMSLGGGVIIGGQQVSVVATVSHDEVASAMAVLSLIATIGGAIGNSISGGIWTNTLPGKLQQLLPDSVKDQWRDIYDDLDVQLSYAVGTLERTAIMDAYAGSQKLMLIAGTCIMGLALIWMMMLKNVNLKKIDQVKGMVL
ncbi:siderophore transporter [Cordyceps javanica]|uniref:Siderophore transporter n=1 Tax=Cordyceps javanica TaxID=43265 RepID=A0A545UNX6_9HYPO|nr:siderophore transporter [Cordyceps javanica]TQW03070.1 siderophore transporter [Cordyceps javanica]